MLTFSWWQVPSQAAPSGFLTGSSAPSLHAPDIDHDDNNEYNNDNVNDDNDDNDDDDGEQHQH